MMLRPRAQMFLHHIEWTLKTLKDRLRDRQTESAEKVGAWLRFYIPSGKLT